MARALVTGGAGFLGSHLCDRLLAEGCDVVAVDNLVTGSTRNIAHLDGNPHFQYVEQDIIQPYSVDGPVDGVYHFASPASPVDYLELPLETLLVGSAGTHNTLEVAKAKGARFLMASTSEVYGDPTIHPQPEEYWGNVNPHGTRSVYDEAKRYAESVTFAYRRLFDMDAKIVRIFNSVLAHETVLLFDDDRMRLMPVGEYARQLDEETVARPRRLRVPAFDPATGRVTLREASAFIKHPPGQKDAFVLKTRYGRHIHVTGDHSVFRRAKGGLPEAVPVREMRVGDHVAIAGILPMVEQDRTGINIAEEWVRRSATPAQLWELALVAPEIKGLVAANRARVWEILEGSGRFDGSASPHNTAGCVMRKCERDGLLPLYVWENLRREQPLAWPAGARVRPYTGGAKVTLPNEVALTDDLLWFLGFFLAEGHVASHADKGAYFISVCSHDMALNRAKGILRNVLGVSPGSVPGCKERGPSVYVHSKLLCWMMSELLGVGGLSHDKRIPGWIMQLPLRRLKHFLDGYREGDGTHSGADVGRKLNFVTVSERLAHDLTYALLRFGIVASLGKYQSWMGRKADTQKRFPFYSLTVCRLSDYDILTWDSGVTQTLSAGRFGDLVWARVNAIEPTETTPYVYDFSVPECENFVAGTGVFAHNTFGPRMRLNDGRVVPAFIGQALRGEDLTVFGDGKQTRSFCYVSDLIDGIYRLSISDQSGPINVGNPSSELTMIRFAEEIIRLTGARSKITYVPLPTADDPKQRRPDITKARALLGWEPRVPLADGLRETIAYFQTRLTT